jgi:hypothetical protein
VTTVVASEAFGTAPEAPRKQRVEQRLVAPGAVKAARSAEAGRPQRPPQRLIRFHERKLGAQPVLSYRGVADPTVVRYDGGWLAVSTGPAAPRAVAPQPGGPWTNIPSALEILPSWAISGRIWASDLVQVDSVWVLYFSAEVAGLGLDGRCIGTATAADPTQPFTPDERPLVCPKQAVAPAAYDKIKRRGRDMPKAGVIDPEQFQDRDGTRYLMYRTQSIPSSIRIVPIPASGRAEGGSARSTELVRRGNVIENPTMIRRGRQYVLMTSEGYFGACSYKTTFRRSSKLLDWSKAQRQIVLDTRKTGLCGPGGADLGRGPNGEPLLFFHAWTCPAIGNCPVGGDYDKDDSASPRRSLFAGVLRFTNRQSPRIASWLAPIAPPPPPPPPPPTPTPTLTPTPSPTVTTTPTGTTTPSP